MCCWRRQLSFQNQKYQFLKEIDQALTTIRGLRIVIIIFQKFQKLLATSYLACVMHENYGKLARIWSSQQFQKVLLIQFYQVHRSKILKLWIEEAPK